MSRLSTGSLSGYYDVNLKGGGRTQDYLIVKVLTTVLDLEGLDRESLNVFQFLTIGKT
jgi:hypothetical protein